MESDHCVQNQNLGIVWNLPCLCCFNFNNCFSCIVCFLICHGPELYFMFTFLKHILGSCLLNPFMFISLFIHNHLLFIFAENEALLFFFLEYHWSIILYSFFIQFMIIFSFYILVLCVGIELFSFWWNVSEKSKKMHPLS